MKVFNKRALTICLTIILAFAMAVPAFAADGSYSESTRYYRFTVPSDGGTFLNLKGATGTSLYMRRLCLYRTSAPGTDQNFKRVFVVSGVDRGYYYGQKSGSQWYMINEDNAAFQSGRNAFMWPVAVQQYEINGDSLMNDHTGYGQLRLLYGSRNYLTYQSTASGTAVYFASTPANSWNSYLV